MADGSLRDDQVAFNFPPISASRLRPGEIIVDLFAGGGGASEALKQALGRDPDIAINHDMLAIGMHAANHPLTRHMREDVWQACPIAETRGQPVGWFHASPDCTHFSQAKGGQPRDRATRSLAWVIPKWCGKLRRQGRAPRIGSMENVWQMLKWGPLVAKRCKITGRVVKLDGTVAAKGERVPLQQQFLIPDKRREGQSWRKFVRVMQGLGYAFEWRKLKACDYGAGTTRERLFGLFRRDGEPIQWPAPTHGKAPGLQPYVTAADCIDWAIPCPSIFTRKKPLADATHRRIARGIQRYVLSAAEPFIVGVGGRQGQSPERSVHGPMQTITAKADSCVCAPTLVACANASANGVAAADAPLGTITAWPKGGSTAVVAAALMPATHQGSDRVNDVTEPLPTITAAQRGELMVSAAHLVKFRGDSTGSAADEPMPTITSGAGAARPAGAAHAMGVAVGTMVQVGYGEREGQAPRALDLQDPLGVVTAGGVKHAAVTAFLEQANGGFYDGAGNDVRKPAPTICGTGSQQRLVTAHITAMAQNVVGQQPEQPLPTVLAGAARFGVVECTLSPEHEAGALRVAAFLMRYYGSGGQHGELDQPCATITTKDRLALVTVTIKGTPYVIVDIGLRMLKPHELFRAQGFPAGYIIDRTADGRRLTTSAAVRMVGNSVSPPPLYALARANLERATQESLAA